MFHVAPDFDLGILRATASGAALHVSECQRMFDEIDEAVQLTGIHCVLLEVAADHAPGEAFKDKLRLANRLVNDPTLHETRFAYVATHGADIDPVVEVLAQAKGFQGQKFDNRTEALEWLQGVGTCMPDHASASPDDAPDTA